MKEINVLGSTWTVEEKKLEETCGYADGSVRQIVVCIPEPEPMALADMTHFTKRVMRHEIIHAFLLESGLGYNSDWAENEEMVDWFARQFSKLHQAFQDADCL